ncbi:trimeric intracellular cation channel family protein [Nocardioides pakistanensis]
MQTSAAAPGVLLVILDLAGIFVFALSGGLVGVRKGLDVFGVLVLASATGLGGGFLRDVLIGAVPPAALADWRYLVVPVVAGILTFWFHPTLGRMERLVTVFDAAGLGLFCVVGALKAIDYGLGPVPAALMGTLTAVGGGVVRDLLAGRVPVVLRSELYATPALVGAALAVTMDTQTGLSTSAFAVPAAALATGWRLLAIWRGWQAPRPAGTPST